ncbi:hypothetical protein O181_041354 [Austropuccinia psidii MF-1]|uniref:Uncharacterized protein n=1 Tax=Austropuccinia psidii MF-1 TaxID=1389203 RepID=A0A9Q3HGE4_9BASI|nr:hypothetical protein [Austropuccinia psidii MF-1]
MTLEMSSKMTEITESSYSLPPHSVLCGSGAVRKLGPPWSMASSGYFDAHQMYDGYNEVEILDPPFSEIIVEQEGWAFWERFPVPEAPTSDGTSGYASLTGSRKREVARWTNVGGPIPTGGRPIYSSSQVPISRINNQGVVKIKRKIADSPTNPNAEGSDELDGEEVEFIHPLVGHSSSSSPTQPPYKEFYSSFIPSTPRNFQPVLYSLPSFIPPPSPEPSTYRPVLASPMKPSPIPQPRPSPIPPVATPAEEENLGLLCHSLLLKYLEIGSIGQSGLTERIQLW